MADTTEVLDDLDRKIVVALQADGRSSWEVVAQACGASPHTVARRGQRLIDSGVARIIAIPEVGSDGPIDTFFAWIRCQAGAHVRVAAELMRRPDVRFAAIITGWADIIAELVLPRGNATRAATIVNLSDMDGIERIQTDLVVHVYKISHDWSQQLLHPGADTVITREPHVCDPAHLDDQDRQIIDLLREDGRASFRALAKSVRLNESTTRRRLDRLLARGCVSIITLVAASALGLEAEATLTIRVAPGKVDAVAQRLAEQRMVRYLAAMLDRSSLVCEVNASSNDALYRFVTSQLAHIDGVIDWTAALELVTLKRAFVPNPVALKSLSVARSAAARDDHRPAPPLTGQNDD